MLDLAVILPFLGPGAKVLGTVIESFRGKSVSQSEIEQTVRRSGQEELQRTPAFANTPAPRRPLIETALIGAVVITVLKADQWSDMRIGQTADGLQFGVQRGPAPSDQNLMDVLLKAIQAQPIESGVASYEPPAIEAPGYPVAPYPGSPGYGPVHNTGHPTGAPSTFDDGYAVAPYTTYSDGQGDPYAVFEEVHLDSPPYVPASTPSPPQVNDERQQASSVADALVHRHNEVMDLVDSRPTAAARMMKVILDDMVATLGTDHETTIHAHRNYAYILGRSDQYAESVREYEKSLPSFARVFGSEQRITVLAWMDYGFQLMKSGDSAAAIETFEAILPALEAELGTDHEEVVFIRRVLESFRNS
ncbi:tetratricopeptide repeat protein [Glycomyces sp. YM15]|uniref:tetratricopeptide repeat protein n=1 Tax=Glycomyces sp. YM15 TaxID=2800446 RepID=UPI00196268DA|nr:tetratricopeptide repeat protein [Glycomyces sp. YM15]